MFGLIPPPPLEDTSLRMMKQNAVNQPGSKGGRGVSQQFEFINLLNSPGLTDVGTKKAVRAHAMRDFRRRRGESYDNGRRKEISNIKTADPSKPSLAPQPCRNGVAFGSPEWALSTNAAEDSLSLSDTAYTEDFQYVTHRGENNDVLRSPFSFGSDTSFHGSILADGEDELGTMLSPERPSKRKKLHDSRASSITLGGNGDECGFPFKSQEHHAANEMIVPSPRLIKIPGNGSPDPFNALPIASTKRVRILVNHCKLIKPLNMESCFVFASSSYAILVSSPKM